MANFRKSFNFRNGVQVDNDNFIVDPNGLVGIGTSVPSQLLDIRGTNSGAVTVSGLTTTTVLGVGETANFHGEVKVGTGITLDATSGVISATKFVGDASLLSGIFAISTTGWVAQGVGLHTFRSIGIGTTNPEYSLQIGLNPETSSGVAISDSGNIKISGVSTANSFVGNLTGDVTGTASTANNLSDAANITTGTINDARLPNVITSDVSSSGVSTFTTVKVGTGITLDATSGVITATSFSGPITGAVTGNADTASALQTARNITIAGAVESPATSFNGSADITLNTSIGSTFSANTSGIITSQTLSATEVNTTNLDVGIGTFNNIRLNNSSVSDIVITSDTSSSVSIGKSVGAGNSSVELTYTPGVGRLDFNNYDIGGFSFNLHSGTGTGTTEGFNVKYDNTKQFEITYDGKVGVNRGATPLTRNFEVGGDMFVSNDGKIAGILTIGQGAFEVTLGDGSSIPVPTNQNFNTLSGVSTFFRMNITNDLFVGSATTIGNTLYVASEVGIGTLNNDNFVTGITPLVCQVDGYLYSTAGLVAGGAIGITTNADGSFQIDPRVIPGDLGPTVPSFDYGDFQIDSGASTFISENFNIVPKCGKATVGFGSTNLGLVPKNFDTNKYLSKVGINTFHARSIFDVGTASTTMNSYFIPPSLTQSELDVVKDLWQATTGFGTEQSRKVTPDGIVPGALVYNKTSEEHQVRINSNTFGPMIPIGGIIMWSGAITNIPNGWKLCDGSNGTPDLRNRFIFGAGTDTLGSSYANPIGVSSTGGRIDAVLPLHGHAITDPGHEHNYDGQTTENIQTGSAGVEVVDSNVGINSTTTNVATGITTTSQVGVTLNGDENLPPYYALAFIMRTNA